jgi:hypothetical protein
MRSLLTGIFLIVVTIVVPIVVLLIIGCVRGKLWIASVRRAERDAQAAKRFSNDELVPPAGRGICQQCQRSAKTVYFLSDGRRLCDACYGDNRQEPTCPQSTR